MKYSLRSLMIGVTLIGVALAGWRIVASFCVRSEIWGFRVHAREFPESDDAFAEWIRSQPGVDRAAVARRNGNVEVVLIMNRDLNGNPSVPLLRDSMARFKYLGVGEVDQVFP